MRIVSAALAAAFALSLAAPAIACDKDKTSAEADQTSKHQQAKGQTSSDHGATKDARGGG